MRYLQIYLKTQPGGSRIHYFINSQIYCLSFQNKSTSVVDKSNMQMLQGDNKKTFIWRQSVWKIADVLIELFRMNSCFLFHRSNILLASDLVRYSSLSGVNSLSLFLTEPCTFWLFPHVRDNFEKILISSTFLYRENWFSAKELLECCVFYIF